MDKNQLNKIKNIVEAKNMKKMMFTMEGNLCAARIREGRYHERKFVFGACQSCKSYPESHAGRAGEKNTIYGRRKYDLADYFSD